ncbi:MAG: MATE family efflux transporter [Planctomycetota bacterium]|nr:MATE family efflux transporter [Planctomycetota bacterium]MDA1213909.1 MATE family efflux transporter [Planctomycetota bacterium]
MSAEPDTSQPAQAGSLRELLHVAWPLILGSGSLSLMNIVDRILLTWYSTDALAAAMPSAMLHFTLMSLAIGTATYVTAFVAQYEGANQPARAAAVTWQGLYFVMLFGGGVLVCVPFSESIFATIGHEPEVQHLEAVYFRIMCIGSIPMLATSVMSSFFSGIGSSRVVMGVNLFAVCINLLLDCLLIFGSFFTPRMGIEGAAWATVAAQALGCLLFMWLMVKSPRVKAYDFFYHWKLDRDLFARLVRYGLPNGWTFLSDVAGFSVFILLIGKLGTAALAATNLTFNLNTLAFLPMLGIGTAVMTLVGQRIGEGRPELAVKTTWLAFWLTTGFMTLCGTVYILIPEIIMSPYWMGSETAPPAEIKELVPTLLKFVALYCLFDGMAIVFGSAIRGAGDTRFSLWFSLIAGWSIMVLPTYIAWKYFDGNLLTSWGACSAYIIVLGIGFMTRFQQGRWKSMRVIEQPLIDDVPSLEVRPLVDDNPAMAEMAHIATPDGILSAADHVVNIESDVESFAETRAEPQPCTEE